MSTKQIFCANEQEVTTHTLSMEPMNGEIVATCPCGRFLKFPSTVTPDEFNDLVTAHEVANKGQVSTEHVEKLLSELGDTNEDKA